MKKLLSLAFIFSLAQGVFSQDTLPNFTLLDRGNKAIISWTNPFESLIQLNVQRSYDSLRNFSTIFSATSPELPQNGYTDTKVAGNRIFYRIFYVLQGGNYFFTKARRAGSAATTSAPGSRDINSEALLNVDANDKRQITIRIRNSIYKQMPAAQFHSFRDSVLRLTKDTLFAVNDSLVTILPFVGRDAWQPSQYIFLDKNGYVSISVPSVTERKYNIKFFEENGTPVFEIKNVKESPLILDKSNFVHAGWYQFELFEDNKLKEKNKFYLPKDF